MSKQQQPADVAVILNEKVNNALANNNKVLFERAFAMSSAILELRTLLTPEVMKPIMALQGTKLGFRTDKDTAGGYPEEVVKNCIIEATLSGFQVIGNHFNIIGGNTYGTKEGFGFLLKNYPGLHYEIIAELPRINAAKDGAAVMMKITWTLDDKTFNRKIEFPVKMNAYAGVDAAIGKATRKARAWLYNTLTGTEIGEGDIQDVPHVVVANENIKTAEEVKDNKEDERLMTMISESMTLTALGALKPHVKTDAQKAAYNAKFIELGKTQEEKTKNAAAATVDPSAAASGSERQRAADQNT